nr:MAG TPA: integrase [Caudoviricetes sp.]
MQERNVTVIPATRTALHRLADPTAKRRRVAGYARVSTEKDEQYTSYEAQVDYYTQFIKRHADWEFIKVYTDEGISGLGTRKRDGFNEMIGDALAGSIDLIITKSVSRFARNTVDSLVTIRKLKEKGVEVYFEKENIYSLDGKGELLLTIMSSLAQEESRSISENVTWGQRKRFSDGKVSLPYKQFLGYERGQKKDDPPVVNPDQAVIVRRIYRTFMQGKTACTIAKELTADGIPTPAGKKEWRASTVKSILQNEKYRGSALLQKCFTTDFLTKKQKVNEGEVPQYYIEHSHEAIIDPLEWDAVQEEIKRRRRIGKAYSGKSVFSAKLICGDCGGWYGPKTLHSTDKYRTTVWRCNCKYKGSKRRCSTPSLSEDEIKDGFTAAFNGIITSKEPYIAACVTAKSVLTDTSSIDAEMAELLREMEVVAELTRKCIEENSSVAQDQSEYTARYNGYVDRYERAKARYDSLAVERREKQEKAKAIDRFIHTVESREGLLSEFDPCLWLATVENVTVMSDGKMRFHFFDGTEITN